MIGDTEAESTKVGMESCPACGSRDNLARYSDGHGYCFGCRHHEPGEGSPINHTRTPRMLGMIHGEHQALGKRGLSLETCQKFDYRVGPRADGRVVQIASYRNAAGEVVAQHTRDAAKGFLWVGDAKEATLWGRHLWRGTGRRIVVTEGEIDAMSVAQAFGLTWDVVSLPSGATGASKAVKASLDFLEGYDTVCLWFDDDAPGRDATAECAPLFSPGRCAVVQSTGHKDANDLLLASGPKAVCKAVYDAKVYRPDGIVTLDEITEAVLAAPETGRPWPFAGLTKATFGRRLGDVIGVGAGTGVGKTDLFTECIRHDVCTLGIPTGVVYLEQHVAETGKRIAGKMAGRRFHVPDGSWTQDELAATWDKLKALNLLHLYDAFGSLDWSTVKAKIRYMVSALGCQHIYLDHMTALAAAEPDERKALEGIMAEAASMATSLGFVLHYVSHLATPEGKPHEEGGRVMIRHFKGSRALGFWSHFMIGLERDQSDQSERGRITTLRVLKDRYTGQATGKCFGLAYDPLTGLLTECDLLPDAMRTDETPSAGRGAPFPTDDCPF